jgi:hypothetical protein
MKSDHPKYLLFDELDRVKFIYEMKGLSVRARNVLDDLNINSWDSFYYRLFINNDIKNFGNFRNVGQLTENELVCFMRSILDPDGLFNTELKKFEDEFSQLNHKAKSVLRNFGLSYFETFYYKYVIERKIIDFRPGYYASEETIQEVEKFVESFCTYLGVKVPIYYPFINFNPKNLKIPTEIDDRINNAFKSNLKTLSKTTKSHLTRLNADTFQEFYMTFISPDSLFNRIFNEFGESNLIEILKLRSTLKNTIKQIKTEALSLEIK